MESNRAPKALVVGGAVWTATGLFGLSAAKGSGRFYIAEVCFIGAHLLDGLPSVAGQQVSQVRIEPGDGQHGDPGSLACGPEGLVECLDESLTDDPGGGVGGINAHPCHAQITEHHGARAAVVRSPIELGGGDLEHASQGGVGDGVVVGGISHAGESTMHPVRPRTGTLGGHDQLSHHLR